MASLKCIYKHRYCVLIWSVLQIFLFSAIQFGWPSLVVVLKQEMFYYDLCQNVNKTTTTWEHCVEQDERLSLVFTVGSGLGPTVGLLFVAPFSDHFGPRKARLLCCILFGLTFLFFALADKDRPYMTFPGLITLSGAGLALLVTIFQVANMFDKWKSTVVSVFNGAVDSSAIVLLFFKLVYDAGVALRTIFIFYFIFAIIQILLYTFILPPRTITLERIEAMHKAGNPVTSFENMAEHEIVQEQAIKMEGTLPNGTTTVNHTPGANANVKIIEKNCKSEQDEKDLQVLQLPPPCHVENTRNRSIEDSTPRLLSLMSTVEYIFLVFFLSACNLRLLFYVGGLNSYLEFMSNNDVDTVSQYTNWFGIAQFTGFIFAPLVGFVMDWKPKKKGNQKTDIGFVVSFLLTSFVALLLNILVLVPILSVQYVTFVVQVILRAFVYAAYSAFILHKFPMLHFGKLYGAGHLISSAIGCVQYGLFIVAEDTLGKDQFWVNVSLLVLCLFLYILPGLLWFKEKRQERQRKLAENGIEVCNQWCR